MDIDILGEIKEEVNKNKRTWLSGLGKWGTRTVYGLIIFGAVIAIFSLFGFKLKKPGDLIKGWVAYMRSLIQGIFESLGLAETPPRETPAGGKWYPVKSVANTPPPPPWTSSPPNQPSTPQGEAASVDAFDTGSLFDTFETEERR